MIELRLLGSTELLQDDRALDSFLAGPKRLGILVYLLLSRPRGYQRRDDLLALFWPESNSSSARNALSNMLYQIRVELGEGAVVNRGAEEVRINLPDLVCDVLDFEAALDDGDRERALECYRGELLKGFHIQDASTGFSEWLRRERARLTDLAATAAWDLAEEAERNGAGATARTYARTAAGLAPFSDDSQQRLIGILYRTGDRAGARAAYDAFAVRLRLEWDMDPVLGFEQIVSGYGSAGVQPVSVPVDVGPVVPGPEEPSVPDGPSRKSSSRSFRRYGLPLTAALVLIVVAAWILLPEGSTGDSDRYPPPERSVAVLPFTYLGAEDSTDYFSVGMTEEILTRLAGVGDLSVISRTSVMRYRDTDLPVREIARELGVAAVVEGSVQRVDDRIRITAQLIDARTDHHLWGESYDRPFRDVLGVQSEVAMRIAESLEAELMPSEVTGVASSREVNETAYHLYLRAQHMRDTRDPQSIVRSMDLFRQSVEVDSSFAPAWGGLALAAVWSGLVSDFQTDIVGTPGIPMDSAAVVALGAARRAIAIDSTEAAAYLARALVCEILYRDWACSEQSLRSAMRFAPNDSEAMTEYGWLQLRLGHVEDALGRMRRAMELDPHSWHVHHGFGYALHCAALFEASARELQTAIDLGSRDPNTLKYLSVALMKRAQELIRSGNREDALSLMDRADGVLSEVLGEDPLRRDLFEVAIAGDTTRTELILDELDPDFALRLYANSLSGRTEELIHQLDEFPFMARAYVDPLFDPVREDPRFEGLVEAAFGDHHTKSAELSRAQRY